jgi:hypothetical protein
MNITQANSILLNEWYELQETLKVQKAHEMELRLKIFGEFFPEPEEGTNNFELPEKWVLKGKRTINRNVDIAAFTALRPALEEAGIRVAEIVEFKPALSISQYRKLTDEQVHLVDQFLIIKDGAPALEIVLPKKASK